MRRLYRFFAVLMVGFLAAGVLVVAGSPAGAANNAIEVLDEDDNRPLAGSTRYQTAERIAQKFVDEAFETESYIVREAVIVSGEGFADALSAAALAGNFRAPILLTPPNALASVVRFFITRNNIDDVYIVGGTAAVSQSVADSLDALAGVSVTRLSGSNRYLTALAVAEEVGGTTGSNLGSYCNTRDQTVLLANGEGFADALAGGPLAYSGPHPILLTPRSGLPDSVLDYLDEARVDRVIILGGTAVIPTAIENTIRNDNIEVKRLAGNDRFATAVAVTKALTIGSEDCGWIADDFGLANARSPYDAFAGSALLGQRQSPLLLTERDELPTATANYLASTPLTRGGDATTVRFSVLGGINTVTRAVVTQAINTTTTSSPITAEIVANPGVQKIIINFSEDVDEVTAELASSYSIDNDPLINADEIQYYVADETADNTPAHVVITLDNFRLRAGEIIRVAPNAIKTTDYRQGDNRFVQGVSYKIPEDRLRPRVTIFAVNGADEIWIRLSELPYDRDGNTLSSFEVTVDPRGSGSNQIATATATSHDELLWRTNSRSTDLSTDDRVFVAAREIYDLAENSNSLTRVTVARNAEPRLQELTVSRFRYPEQADTGDLSGLSGLSIATRSVGKYAGAKGNAWSVEFLDASTNRVFITESRKRVLFEVRDRRDRDDGTTLEELLAVADASSAFSNNFQFVGRANLTSDDLTDEINPIFGISNPLDNGSTTAVVLARWSLPVEVTESDIEVCSASCSRTAGAIPSPWDLTDRSASSSGFSEFLEWEVTETADETDLPTSAWSMRFEEDAVEGPSDRSDTGNRLTIRRIRVGN